MTIKKAKKEASGKAAIAELTKVQDDVKQLSYRADLQEKMGVRLFTMEEVKERFILDPEQSVPYIRGREKKKNEPVALMKCKKQKSGPVDLYYIVASGRAAARLSDRYSILPQKPKETIREKIDLAQEKRGRLKLSDRYGKKPKKNSRRY